MLKLILINQPFASDSKINFLIFDLSYSDHSTPKIWDAYLKTARNMPS
jgi:hypothetical protein